MTDSRRKPAMWRTTLGAVLLAASAVSHGDTPAATSVPASARAARPPNYVDAAAFDFATLLPPAPQKDSVRYEADRRMFLQTRRLKDSPRWIMAARDADARPADFLQHFSCALDLELAPASAPQITKLAQNLSADAGRVTGSAKDHYRRERPYLIDEGITCRPQEETGKSYDYPSGHTIAGWAQSSAQYQADLAAARAEYAELRHSAPRPQPARCADEARLVAMPLD